MKDWPAIPKRVFYSYPEDLYYLGLAYSHSVVCIEMREVAFQAIVSRLTGMDVQVSPCPRLDLSDILASAPRPLHENTP
jgi:hypothetical protein